MNPRVSAQFTGDGARVLHQLEAETGKLFFFEGSEGLPLDHFEVVDGGQRRRDRRARGAVRGGRRGAWSTIVEPHMYNVDDAVAKIDGYIISVTGGGTLVGSQGARPDRGGGPHRGARDGDRRARGAATATPRGRRATTATKR